MNRENAITKNNNILLILSSVGGPEQEELKNLRANFCGQVYENISELPVDLRGKRIYFCGDISRLPGGSQEGLVIEELSSNYNPEDFHVVKLGRVPVLVHQMGIYYRAFFDESDYFLRIQEEHEFQQLTESTKPGQALRKGIYLTKVSKIEAETEEQYHFHLLRCSSNLTGPTDNFRETDQKIIQQVNQEARFIFAKKTDLNHVLAQVYTNRHHGNKERKAKIKAHSDKTKDMPPEGVMAFCTFYDPEELKSLKPSQIDRYDFAHKKHSALTSLHFRLKKSVSEEGLPKEFSVRLYPNSVFFMPLSTNRLYTHEIKPSMLNIDQIPTRLGYVIRCSATEAIFKDGQTYIKDEEQLIPLQPDTPETMKKLRSSYFEENSTINMVEYGKVHFSMNQGDYQKPIY